VNKAKIGLNLMLGLVVTCGVTAIATSCKTNPNDSNHLKSETVTEIASIEAFNGYINNNYVETTNETFILKKGDVDGTFDVDSTNALKSAFSNTQFTTNALLECMLTNDIAKKFNGREYSAVFSSLQNFGNENGLIDNKLRITQTPVTNEIS
jgi:hypothetical protein